MIDDIIIVVVVVVVVSVRFVNKEKKKWHIYGFLNECDVIIYKKGHIFILMHSLHRLWTGYRCVMGQYTMLG